MASLLIASPVDLGVPLEGGLAPFVFGVSDLCSPLALASLLQGSPVVDSQLGKFALRLVRTSLYPISPRLQSGLLVGEWRYGCFGRLTVDVTGVGR